MSSFRESHGEKGQVLHLTQAYKTINKQITKTASSRVSGRCLPVRACRDRDWCVRWGRWWREGSASLRGARGCGGREIQMDILLRIQGEGRCRWSCGVGSESGSGDADGLDGLLPLGGMTRVLGRSALSGICFYLLWDLRFAVVAGRVGY
jgi:hypothetical protein